MADRPLVFLQYLAAMLDYREVASLVRAALTCVQTVGKVSRHLISRPRQSAGKRKVLIQKMLIGRASFLSDEALPPHQFVLGIEVH
jgi:hypothetical protein